MKKLIGIVVFALAASIGTVSAASAYTAANPTYTTNDLNRANHGPHVDLVRNTGQKLTLVFVNPNPYSACFEYRTDGDPGQIIGVNYNTAITDGLYPFVCLKKAGTRTMVIKVTQYLEVRSVFGAERDWDFDWTRFDAR
jgi:hypothetical protein